MSRKSKYPVCPKCGGTTIEEQTKGLIFPPPKGHDHDPNKKICYGCGHEWFKICPACAAINYVLNSG